MSFESNLPVSTQQSQNNDHKQEKTLRTHKVILLGDAGVGKTSLFRRYMGLSFPRTTETTLTTRPSFPRHFQDCNGQPIEVDIWDTAGAERMRSLTENYFRQTSAALMVYDVTSYESFDTIVSYWAESIISREPAAKLFLIGNKIDLIKGRDYEDTETLVQAEKFMETQNIKIIKHFKVSAKTDEGVEVMYHQIAQCLDDRDDLKKTRSTIKISESFDENQPKAFDIINWLKTKCQL
ncbi:uncharacterized protein [Ptychodera flava]|uniref:uncharacterized protein n=1 Tax=Ptychodera flava TaxID=63121 RepID=UPI00396A4F45